jgi:hypothetical protein
MENKKEVNQETLDATITYLEGLPTDVDQGTAVANIDAWAEKVRSTDKPGMQEIADELQTLRSLLFSGTGGARDGKAIGSSMHKLGEQTKKAAEHADSSVADKLRTLGKWLSQVGQGLS